MLKSFQKYAPKGPHVFTIGPFYSETRAHQEGVGVVPKHNSRWRRRSRTIDTKRCSASFTTSHDRQSKKIGKYRLLGFKTFFWSKGRKFGKYKHF